ncbi:MAG: hypothetical protein HY430_00730 [Candidatus Levybacteria bacterium]|nr:hypothetical protein [Candidatus Levybacteria bacterium]
MELESPKTRDILVLLAATGFIAAALLMPNLPRILKPFLQKQQKKWGHFDRRRLKAEIKRLRKIGVIDEAVEDGETVFKLSQKGREKVLKYKLEALALQKEKWDGKWRLVVYDIPKGKKNQADAFRRLLKKLQLLQLQKSVYLTPYACRDEVDFLKSLYSIEEHVTLLTISGIEHEVSYKKYFGL